MGHPKCQNSFYVVDDYEDCPGFKDCMLKYIYGVDQDLEHGFNEILNFITFFQGKLSGLYEAITIQTAISSQLYAYRGLINFDQICFFRLILLMFLEV
jgi:uncharacterized protein Usg